MQSKKAYFSVDLELLRDIKAFKEVIKDEPSFINEIKTLLNFFDEHKIKATFFVCYNYIIKNEEIIKEILLRDHDLGLHYVNHHNEEVSIEEFSSEIKKAKEDIRLRFNHDLVGYRAPAFNLTNDQYQVLADLGFKYDSSFFIYKNAFYYSTFEIKDTLKEFPVWSSKQFPLAGGAYLRLLPRFVMKKKFKRYIKKNNYYNFYIHPYDYSSQKIFKQKAPLKMKLFFSKGTKQYLNRIKWMVQQLQETGFTFKLYKED